MLINIGNDELILNIRKNDRAQTIENDDLGKRIWHWIRENDPNASILNEKVPCRWGDEGDFVSRINLPKTAAQFEISVEVLPALYRFINELGDE